MAILDKNKVVLITGATRGIGRAVALRLAADGVKLALCGRDKAKLDAVAEAARAAGASTVLTAAFDLSDEAAILALCQRTLIQLGPVDVLINNAGCNLRKEPLWEVSTQDFDAMMAVNLRAPFLFMREVFPGMQERRCGHIINILSTVCLFDNPTMGIYTAAKKGLQGLTDVFRKEARAHQVRVTSIYPGGTDTDFRAADRPDYMRPESVAETVRHVLTVPDDLVYHHVTFRPMVEENF